jgi:protoporphyrinogen oxidase
MGKTYVVAGAGFRGFCDALELMRTPGNKVYIVDPAPFFGGVMYSADVKGFAVDNGVHVFDSIPRDLASIVNEIMDGRTRTIDFISASAFNGVITEGFSLPDLASLDEKTKQQIKKEILDLAKRGHSKDTFTSLDDLFRKRFGETAGGIFSRILRKVYNVDAGKVEPYGLSQTSLHRLKFLDDAEMMKLKSDPWLDTILAARRKSIGKVDDLVSIYPDTGEAMRGWCIRAAEWLKAKGVTIILGTKITSIKDNGKGVTVTTDNQTIEADKVIWANDNTAALGSALGFDADVKGLQHGTPMIFVTLMTRADKIRDFTYLQNFDPDQLTYRTAAAGIFSNQIRDDGVSFITSECPAAIGREHWQNTEAMVGKVWEECKALGIIMPDAELADSYFARVPSTFKLPLLGYTDRINEFYQEIPKRSQRVILRNVIPFFRREIYLDSLNLRSLVE